MAREPSRRYRNTRIAVELCHRVLLLRQPWHRAADGPGAIVCFVVSRQKRKKIEETFSIKSEVRRQLPQDRTQLFVQSQNAGGEKVRQWRLRVPQLFHVSDKSRSFNAK